MTDFIQLGNGRVESSEERSCAEDRDQDIKDKVQNLLSITDRSQLEDNLFVLLLENRRLKYSYK